MPETLCRVWRGKLCGRKARKDLCDHLYWALEHEFSVIKALDGTEGFATTETDEPEAWPE